MLQRLQLGIVLTLQELREQLRLPSRDAAAAAQAARASLPGPMPPPTQPTHRQAAAGAAQPAAGQAGQTEQLTVDAAARLPEGAPAAVAGLLTSDPRRVAVQCSPAPFWLASHTNAKKHFPAYVLAS